MKYLQLAEDLKVSQLAFGCMRISEMEVDELAELIKVALDEGINFFDHADIYGGGKSEELFGEVLKKHPEYREKMIIQTKCAIRRGKVGYFDFSKEHIINSVNQSLKRLQTDHIEILLLHRPDTLMDPKEVADAFQELYDSGKVKYFGVSNMNSMQMELLQSEVKQKLLFNQLQFSPIHAGMVTNGLFVNMKEEQAIDHDGSILEYCRLKKVTIQPWSIMQASWEEGTYLDNPDYQEFNDCLQAYADAYKVSKTAIVIAWILRHPANMQPIFGTTKAKHIQEMCAGCDIELSREDWYEIYIKAIGRILP
ncbi:putative oxidoreductase [Breznakia sp. PF5-3]|uniref:aldo/keto reductase n=1 Tax=unclassified Breznakia TaxID=2623764 RepID=UPI0024072699|nr:MULTISPECIES: aldo/keto reductase [unclassified Breznakia]MDF9825674.1 putative oxidoreductase [Breznakia sp. PM6-1]MDF9836515.1 putative oxidoreductase [Breznakia sp. PF5-3]MDF9837818.1 putative oxidoreductase [Breznakia sp. PFB2-8]MDF9859738.1 putative oxidoreductase [Breznakia sp. PH5-24]